MASPFHLKARQMRAGWKHWEKALTKDGRRTAWFHASSLGEFEQARPVMELFRQRHPEYRIVLTFFSPSGYEVRKDYKGADIVCYLPPDTRRNARRLVMLMHPDIAFFVKYDFWFNYLQALQRRRTPTYLFSAIFRPSQYFFKWYGGWFADKLGTYEHIFVQNEESLKLLACIGLSHVSLAGDTRFDRVNDIALQAKRFPDMERFISSGGEPLPALMAGSSWEPDERNIKHFLDTWQEPLKVILAPHVIDAEHLHQIEVLFGEENCLRYSDLVKGDPGKRRILIIDNIGMLSSLYRYASVAYIGGGFGKGIHNILEAAVFGTPVCFGPNWHKFQEARDMLECGGAKSYDTPGQLTEILSSWLNDKSAWQQAADAASTYMKKSLGATKIIMDKIERK